MIINVRLIANLIVAVLLFFLMHRYFMFWHEWPSLSESLTAFSSQADASSNKAWWVLLLCFAFMAFAFWYSLAQKKNSLMKDSKRYASWSAYIIRFAFWSVFLIGIVDTTISALRVENSLISLLGKEMDIKIGLSRFRGLYVHYPLLVLSLIIAAFTRNLSMIWLALLVVISEFLIVILRFVFSYEQAYMGDLVRFWYAALFLFASAYTFIEEGHVRVDVIYAGMKARSKAWVNTIGCLVLGIPFCMTILYTGMESRHSSLISPIINFEISQSGYGMQVKYLMAGFLIIFALSMAFQFVSYFLSNSAFLLGDKTAPKLADGGH